AVAADSGTVSVTRATIRVNCVTPSMRPRVASTAHSMPIHSSFEARPTERKLRMKKLENAATSSDSGDHWSPDPPNCDGAALARAGAPGVLRITCPAAEARPVTE